MKMFSSARNRRLSTFCVSCTAFGLLLSLASQPAAAAQATFTRAFARPLFSVRRARPARFPKGRGLSGTFGTIDSTGSSRTQYQDKDSDLWAKIKERQQQERKKVHKKGEDDPDSHDEVDEVASATTKDEVDRGPSGSPAIVYSDDIIRATEARTTSEQSSGVGGTTLEEIGSSDVEKDESPASSTSTSEKPPVSFSQKSIGNWFLPSSDTTSAENAKNDADDDEPSFWGIGYPHNVDGSGGSYGHGGGGHGFQRAEDFWSQQEHEEPIVRVAENHGSKGEDDMSSDVASSTPRWWMDRSGSRTSLWKRDPEDDALFRNTTLLFPEDRVDRRRSSTTYSGGSKQEHMDTRSPYRSSAASASSTPSPLAGVAQPPLGSAASPIAPASLASSHTLMPLSFLARNSRNIFISSGDQASSRDRRGVHSSVYSLEVPDEETNEKSGTRTGGSTSTSTRSTETPPVLVATSQKDIKVAVVEHEEDDFWGPPRPLRCGVTLQWDNSCGNIDLPLTE
ncbi:unnamed protein product [Amoebophrya sp. A25]|nr:unnamed protein product [Amoebophrya sp. A25]|eukprot:GSA25T00003082001.1